MIQGYGGEDRDFNFRLSLANLETRMLPISLIEGVIEHDDDQRTVHYKEQDPRRGKAVNTAYRQMKDMILLLNNLFEIDFNIRVQLYEQVRTACYDAWGRGKTSVALKFELPHDGTFAPIRGYDFKRMIGIEVRLTDS